MTYTIIFSTYHNGKLINCIEGTRTTEEVLPTEEVIEINWDNLEEVYCKKGLFVSFNVWNCKKGRKVSFFLNGQLPFGDYADVKEWKTKDLNITFKAKYFLKNA